MLLRKYAKLFVRLSLTLIVLTALTGCEHRKIAEGLTLATKGEQTADALSDLYTKLRSENTNEYAMRLLVLNEDTQTDFFAAKSLFGLRSSQVANAAQLLTKLKSTLNADPNNDILAYVDSKLDTSDRTAVSNYTGGAVAPQLLTSVLKTMDALLAEADTSTHFPDIMNRLNEIDTPWKQLEDRQTQTTKQLGKATSKTDRNRLKQELANIFKSEDAVRYTHARVEALRSLLHHQGDLDASGQDLLQNFELVKQNRLKFGAVLFDELFPTLAEASTIQQAAYTDRIAIAGALKNFYSGLESLAKYGSRAEVSAAVKGLQKGIESANHHPLTVDIAGHTSAIPADDVAGLFGEIARAVQERSLLKNAPLIVSALKTVKKIYDADIDQPEPDTSASNSVQQAKEHDRQVVQQVAQLGYDPTNIYDTQIYNYYAQQLRVFAVLLKNNRLVGQSYLDPYIKEITASILPRIRSFRRDNKPV